MCPDNLEKSRPKLIWNGLGFSSRHPFHLSLFGSNFCPVATFLCLLVAENNFESASEGLPFCWAEHFPNDFCYSISSLDDEHLFQLFPFGSALCSAQTTIKQGSFVSVLSHELYFHNELFSPVFAYFSASVVNTQCAGASDTTPFLLPTIHGSTLMQGGYLKDQPTTDSYPSGIKGPAHSRAIRGVAKLLSAGNGRWNHHFASCCVIILTVGVSYWIHFHIANVFAVRHQEGVLTMDP